MAISSSSVYVGILVRPRNQRDSTSNGCSTSPKTEKCSRELISILSRSPMGGLSSDANR